IAGPLMKQVAAGRRLVVMAALCAAAALIVGLAYFAIRGAPLRYGAVNAAAFAVGLAAAAALSIVDLRRNAAAVAGLAAGAALIGVSAFGASVDGVQRWVSFGGLSLQPGLILAPALVALVGVRRDTIACLAAMLASAGLALQPDRATTTAFAAALAVEALVKFDKRILVAAGVGVAAMAASFVQPDAVPPQMFVENVAADAFAAHAALGLAVAAALALACAPYLFAASASSLGVFWAGAAMASVIGAYPTPLVGYGASAILGYLIGAGVASARTPRR
ncbi:MAG: hypothetical protein K2Q06_06405, partial [Parvularculaceae bacterium]|nr:hypothetical protein [Parvularculaceae bacterium]